MLERELEEGARIAREAGNILMRIYETDFDVAYKSKSDPVTDADTQANAYLVTELRQLFPDDGIVAEETADQSDALRRGRVWYVDPLDGTKEFIAKNGEFAVMLGLSIDGVSTLGVVYQPEHDKLYLGAVGHGAQLQCKGTTEELRVSEVSQPAELKLVVSRSHRGPSTSALVERLGIKHEIRSGSVGLKVGMIAEQRADLYVHISDKSSKWDACGPEAILKAAGGRFTDLTGNDYQYIGSDMQNRGGILACNSAAYDEVLSVARDIAEQSGMIVRPPA